MRPYAQATRITIQPFTLKNVNIFYFEKPSQIAIWLFSIKKGMNISEQLNGNSATCASHSAIHIQTQTQTESEAFKTHMSEV